MAKHIINNILKLITIALLISSCESNPLDVDVSSVHVEMDVLRFEQDLFAKKDSVFSQQASAKLHKKYGEFYTRYTEDILNLGTPGDPALAYNINRFITDKDVVALYNDVKKKHKTIDEPMDQLKEGFRHYAHYFPDATIPTVTTYISGFNYALVATDSFLAVGLDMFLGQDYHLYEKIGFPKYKSRKMEAKRIPYDAMKAWIQTEFPKPRAKTLLDDMLYEGRYLYALEAMYPNTPDSILMAYTESEMHWMEQNEHQMWGFFVKEELFYTQNYGTMAKFINDGPFTSGLDKASPARTGVWLGWQIVRAYMAKHPNTTLRELFELDDSQHILSTSGYKPN